MRSSLPISYEVFDIDANWKQVTRVLRCRQVLRALDAGMVFWCDVNRTVWPNSPCVDAGYVWDRRNGPWSYVEGDYWWDEAESRFYRAGGHFLMEKWYCERGCPRYSDDPTGYDAWFDEHDQEWFEEQIRRTRLHLPQPNTPDWFRCWGACHYLAAWNCAVGQAMFPSLDWTVAKGKQHSTAVGTCGNCGLIVDILWGFDHTGKGILQGVGKEPEVRTLDEEIKWLDSRPYRGVVDQRAKLRKADLASSQGEGELGHVPAIAT